MPGSYVQAEVYSAVYDSDAWRTDLRQAPDPIPAVPGGAALICHTTSLIFLLHIALQRCSQDEVHCPSAVPRGSPGRGPRRRRRDGRRRGRYLLRSYVRQPAQRLWRRDGPGRGPRAAARPAAGSTACPSRRTGEDTTSYDCVSFISQTDCAAYSWSGLTPSWMAANCAHMLPTPAPTPISPAPTPKGFRDNDQDGVEDAAADGTCCAFTYGNAFADCSSATDLAGAAGCCPSDFLLRHSIQATGEDTTSYDCVSFISRPSAAYSAGQRRPGAPANCPHTTSSTVVGAAAPAPSASWRSSPSFSPLDHAVAVALHRRRALPVLLWIGSAACARPP